MNNYTHSEHDVKVVDGQLLSVEKLLGSLIRSLQKRDKDNQPKKNALSPNALRFTVRVKRCALCHAGI